MRTLSLGLALGLALLFVSPAIAGRPASVQQTLWVLNGEPVHIDRVAVTTTSAAITVTGGATYTIVCDTTTVRMLAGASVTLAGADGTVGYPVPNGWPGVTWVLQTGTTQLAFITTTSTANCDVYQLK